MPGSSRRRNASLTGVEEEEEEEEKEEEGHLSFWPKSVCWGGGGYARAAHAILAC